MPACMPFAGACLACCAPIDQYRSTAIHALMINLFDRSNRTGVRASAQPIITRSSFTYQDQHLSPRSLLSSHPNTLTPPTTPTGGGMFARRLGQALLRRAPRPAAGGTCLSGSCLSVCVRSLDRSIDRMHDASIGDTSRDTYTTTVVVCASHATATNPPIPTPLPPHNTQRRRPLCAPEAPSGEWAAGAATMGISMCRRRT